MSYDGNAALRRCGGPVGPASVVVFLSATIGIPPLLTTSVYAARTRITGTTFTITCLLGRSLRFTAIALAPHLFGYGG